VHPQARAIAHGQSARPTFDQVFIKHPSHCAAGGSWGVIRALWRSSATRIFYISNAV